MSRTLERTFSLYNDSSRRGARALDAGMFYRLGRSMGRGIFYITINSHELGAHQIERSGPYILALTHLSHMEPFCASALNHRQIHWITRKEFYKYRPCAWLLGRLD